MKRREFLRVGIGALASLPIGACIQLTPGESSETPRAPRSKRKRARVDYKTAQKTSSVCLNCSTVCGIVGYVVDGELRKVAGNPLDPNTAGTLCAKGQSGPTIASYADRLLYPLRRVGQRGEGLWKRITWEEALEELAQKIGASRAAGHPERVAIHVGRSRINDVITRFLNSIGSPVLLNHRALCSLNKRAANYATIGDQDWETVDAERTKYLLNFGANFYEAHQGAIHFLRRVVRGRFDNGAKLVTFDVRLSNTAGRSDEWHAPLPGSEGAVALALGHVILRENLHDAAFLARWCNVSIEELRAFYAPYTPEWAAEKSGLEAATLERLAREFAGCKPRCAAFTNRGSQAHYNGFGNDRAVVMLNALVGSLGQEGGYCWISGEVSATKFPPPEPVPAAPKVRTDLEDPPEYPLANHWQKMRVGQIVYAYLQERRAKLDVYLSYTLASPLTWPEGRSRTVDVLKDEELIPFHACSDVVYSETAHYADLLLPDATYTERWGLDGRNSYELQPYVLLRQPMTPPPGEARSFAEVLIQVGKRLGPEVAKFFDFADHEAFVRAQCAKVPAGRYASGFDRLKAEGAWVESEKPKAYATFERALKPDELEGSTADPATGIVRKKNSKGVEEAIGLVVDGVARAGFKTPSRRFEVFSEIVKRAAAKVGVEDDGFPRYVSIPAHEAMTADRLHLVTFKWNVHTQGRTAPQKYLTEIVHSNPLWIHPSAAEPRGIRTGDAVELTTFRPLGQTYQATGEELGKAVVRAFVTEGIHPRVVALSNSLGNDFGGRIARGRNGPREEHAGLGDGEDDPDLAGGIWWDRARGGAGAGFNINAILPIQPTPVTGMQAWYDTVCTLRRV
ncbi:MAG: molybdopterin-dependent oxidoreductase [Planctomycetes bacterium]|nr:molybdopterin-dependent oxidoreductase [Planctomycetota bacterium]